VLRPFENGLLLRGGRGGSPTASSGGIPLELIHAQAQHSLAKLFEAAANAVTAVDFLGVMLHNLAEAVRVARVERAMVLGNGHVDLASIVFAQRKIAHKEWSVQGQGF
jgi:hypothetical protein